ncbi:MAG: transposase, partial [Flavobacteriaceae bacterium]
PFQLRDTIRDFKRYSAKRIIGQIRNEPESRRENFMFLFKNAAMKNSKSKGFKFWKTGNHAIDLYSEKFIWDKINYIHNNPVMENFVSRPEDWVYSSASNYLEEESILLEVCVVPQIMKTLR